MTEPQQADSTRPPETDKPQKKKPPKKSPWPRRLFLLVSGIVIVFFFTHWLFQQTKSVAQGVKDDQLARCPDSPNCVCSFQSTELHGIAPISFEGDPVLAFAALKKVMDQMPRTSLISEEETYLHFTFTTAIMGYVDDVECLIDQQSQQIHIRSASRIGHSDLNANRKRVEEIRSRFQQEMHADK